MAMGYFSLIKKFAKMFENIVWCVLFVVSVEMLPSMEEKSETSGATQRITRRHIPEDDTLQVITVD
jgi:hypothetical protein